MACLIRFLATAALLAAATTRASANGCVSGDIDAITMVPVSGNDRVYAFQGEYVSLLNTDGDAIEDGYPKRISDEFPGLPDRIDTAIHWPRNGKNYFFKGDQYWGTIGTQVGSGYPKSIYHGWPGLPDDLDASIYRSDGKAYFLRGSRYWRYDAPADDTDAGYPRPIEGNWGGWKDDVDAAFTWSSGMGYLFKGEQYWRYDLDADRLDTTYTYPKETSEGWFGCQATKIDMAGDPLFN